MAAEVNYRRRDSAGVVSTLSFKGDPNLIIGEEVGGGFFEYRKKWEKVTKFELQTDYPLQIDFELNHSCNMRCNLCGYPSESKTNPGMLFSFEEYKKIVLSGVQKGLCSVNLNFINEPLLRKDIVDFVAFAKDTGVLDIMLSTNGMLLTPGLSEKLIKSGLTRIMISIDAFTEGTYNKIRIGGNFERVTSAVRKLVEARKTLGIKLPIIRVSYVRLSLNEHEEKDFIDYWSKIVDYICIQEFVKPFQDSDKGLRPTAVRTVKDFRCPRPLQRVIIRYDGTVLPCCPWHGIKLPLGNIKEQSIEDIWKSKKMIDLQKLQREGRYFDNPVCRECATNSTVEISV